MRQCHNCWYQNCDQTNPILAHIKFKKKQMCLTVYWRQTISCYNTMVCKGIMAHDWHWLTTDDYYRQRVQCSVGSLPCDPAGNTSLQCVDEQYWCDQNEDCSNGQDEDYVICCQYRYYSPVYHHDNAVKAFSIK